MKYKLHLLMLLLALPLFSQTIVSTTPENKKVILEEFTGINCVFCPQGHEIANTISNNNPGNVFIVNIHSGSFANPSPNQPDFRTPFGTALDNQSSLQGYPAATVNRTVFPGLGQNPGGTAMSRNNWTNASNTILGQSSYVNVGVEAEINVTTRQLVVTVEAYYTGNSPQSTNKMNVALLQNNTFGPQVGGNMGDNYPHMHRLVHMITGQWGVNITSTTQGSFYENTFTYSIPEQYNSIPVDLFLAEMEVVAFVAEGNQTIVSGNGYVADLVGLQNNDLAISDFEEFDEACGLVSPKITIQNRGSSSLSSTDITYSFNNEEEVTYNWTGNLESLGKVEINLPEVSYNVLTTNNTLEISLNDDDDNDNNIVSHSYNLAPIHETNEVELTIKLDQYPQETTWNITNSAGEIVHSGGPYPGQVNQTVTQTLTLSNNDCYEFTIFDEFGDGICCQFGQGFYELKTDEGTMIVNGGQFGSSETKMFSNFNSLSSEGFEFLDFNFYPNPSNGTINFVTEEKFDVSIFNIQGKKVFEMKNLNQNSQINLNQPSGIYIANITSGNKKTTKKLIIK